MRVQCGLHSSVSFGCVQSVYSRKHLVWQLPPPQLTITFFFFFFFAGLWRGYSCVCACVCVSGLSWEITASKLAPGSDRTQPILITGPEQTHERPENTLLVGIYLRVTQGVKTTQPLNKDNSQRQKQADL